MIKCRALTVRGQWVTFDLIRNPGEPTGSVGFTVFYGEGFFVESELCALYHGSHQATMEEKALREAGIDTATAERWDGYQRYVVIEDGVAKARPRWVPLFPPVIKRAEQDFHERIDRLLQPPVLMPEEPDAEILYEMNYHSPVFIPDYQIVMKRFYDTIRRTLVQKMGRKAHVASPVEDPTPDMIQAGAEVAARSIMAYSPISRGFLTDVWRAMEKARPK